MKWNLNWILRGCQIFKETVNSRPLTGGCVYCTYISSTPVLFHASLCKNVLVSSLLHRHCAHAKGVISSVPNPPVTPPLVRYCKITSSQRYSLHARQKKMKTTTEEEAAKPILLRFQPSGETLADGPRDFPVLFCTSCTDLNMIDCAFLWLT